MISLYFQKNYLHFACVFYKSFLNGAVAQGGSEGRGTLLMGVCVCVCVCVCVWLYHQLSKQPGI